MSTVDVSVDGGEWLSERVTDGVLPSSWPQCPSHGQIKWLISFVCLCHREGRTFLRLTSSRRRWWWQGGWGTWGSWARSSTGSATAKKPTAFDVAASTDVSAHLLRQYEMLNNDHSSSCEKHVMSAGSLWFLCTHGGKYLSGESQGNPVSSFWCVGANRSRVAVQKTNTTRTKYRLPSEYFRQCVCSVKSSSNSLVARFQCVCVYVWVQPGNFLLCESLVVQWKHPHTMEEAVMHMSDIFVIAAFDWSESIGNDATNFPQYIYGWDLQGWLRPI